MTKLTHCNLAEVKAGYTVFYAGIPGVCVAEGDTLKVNGMTLTQLLDRHQRVYFAK